MSFFQPQGFTSLLKEGSRHYTGVEESIIRNIEAISEVCTMTRTSLGPNGMNKIIINQLDKCILTKDAGVMMRELDVNHPAARLVINAIKMQYEEMGDNTNLVVHNLSLIFQVTLAGELLLQAQNLIKSGLHPADILTGYEKALKKATELLNDITSVKIENIKDLAEVTKYLKSVVGTKVLHGQESLVTPLIAQACINVLPTNQEHFNIENVRVNKMLGGSLMDSQVIKGLVIVRLVEGAITQAEVNYNN